MDPELAFTDLPWDVVTLIASKLLDTRSLFSLFLSSKSLYDSLYHSHPEIAQRELLRPLLLHLAAEDHTPLPSFEADTLVQLRLLHTNRALRRRQKHIIVNLRLQSELSAARLELAGFQNALEKEASRERTILGQIEDLQRIVSVGKATTAQLWQPRAVQRGFDLVLQQEATDLPPEAALRILDQELKTVKSTKRTLTTSIQRTQAGVAEVEGRCKEMMALLVPFWPRSGSQVQGAEASGAGPSSATSTVVIPGGGQMAPRLVNRTAGPVEDGNGTRIIGSSLPEPKLPNRR